MMRIAAAFLATAALGLTLSAASAESVSPYEMRYQTRSGTALRASIESGSGTVAKLPKGADGIVLRWCRPEIPFSTWQFGSPATWRTLLDERACEIGWNGRVGYVDGTTLTPDR
ncbi:hypothetical protein [Amorphus sp. 3PC139-8]|uniref:hypothetical protein n=1 Tax=Amorphus sp. 3PC139-8 TaxID=2735676 RepID=UPI00345DB1E8